jgi:ribosomal subunit interface protein
MEIIFKGLHTDVPARFREYAIGKLGKLEKLDQKAVRVDVEVSVERNPRQASQKERVQLTVASRGPAIRAEAAAEDRIAALDLAVAKLDARLRRALERRKSHYGPRGAIDRTSPERVAGTVPAPDGLVVPGQFSVDLADSNPAEAGGTLIAPGPAPGAGGDQASPSDEEVTDSDSVVPIEMDGDGPLVVRQKFHRAGPISIDQALFEMELVGHDFYLFHDIEEDMPSVVYRRRGYQYGVIRLVEDAAGHHPSQEMPTGMEAAGRMTAAGEVIGAGRMTGQR